MNDYDLEEIPACLIGADDGRHRHQADSSFTGFVPEFEHSVPRFPGGKRVGCSLAHCAAIEWALSEHPVSPVLLFEDDAVRTQWYSRHLRSVPGTAGAVWLGVSNIPGRPMQWRSCGENPDVGQVTGAAFATHAILLTNRKAKEIWLYLARCSVRGRYGSCIDLVYSIDGWNRVEQYFCRKPLFWQPEHPVTNVPT